jgi:hypothetical protein
MDNRIPCLYFQTDRCENENCPYLHMKIKHDWTNTKICMYGLNCSNKERCGFAHSPQELRKTDCIMGPFCVKPSCRFNHRDFIELHDGKILRKNRSVKSPSTNPLYRTKLCKMIMTGCHNSECSFAHSEEELRITMCRYGEKCRNRNCMFYHEGDDIPKKGDVFKSEYSLLIEQSKTNHPFDWSLNNEMMNNDNVNIEHISLDKYDVEVILE